METHIEHENLADALDALKGFVQSAPDDLKLSLYFYLCAFTLIQEAYRRQPKEIERMDISVAQMAAWAVEFFSNYEKSEQFSETYDDFINWIHQKQDHYLKQLS